MFLYNSNANCDQEYQDVNRTYNDVAQALSHYSSLAPRTDVYSEFSCYSFSNCVRILTSYSIRNWCQCIIAARLWCITCRLSRNDIQIPGRAMDTTLLPARATDGLCHPCGKYGSQTRAACGFARKDISSISRELGTIR